MVYVNTIYAGNISALTNKNEVCGSSSAGSCFFCLYQASEAEEGLAACDKECSRKKVSGEVNKCQFRPIVMITPEDIQMVQDIDPKAFAYYGHGSGVPDKNFFETIIKPIMGNTSRCSSIDSSACYSFAPSYLGDQKDFFEEYARTHPDKNFNLTGPQVLDAPLRNSINPFFAPTSITFNINKGALNVEYPQCPTTRKKTENYCYSPGVVINCSVKGESSQNVCCADASGVMHYTECDKGNPDKCECPFLKCKMLPKTCISEISIIPSDPAAGPSLPPGIRPRGYRDRSMPQLRSYAFSCRSGEDYSETQYLICCPTKNPKNCKDPYCYGESGTYKNSSDCLPFQEALKKLPKTQTCQNSNNASCLPC